MSLMLDREGRFRALPLEWSVRTFQQSQAVAVNVRFRILAQYDYDRQAWTSWENYDEVQVWGMFFVLKKDGGVNSTTVKQLAAALGWKGDLQQVAEQPAPECEVQIAVKAETYQDRVQHKVQWIDPGDADPAATGGAPPAEVKKLQAQFGSLLRAAASAAVKDMPRRNGAAAHGSAAPQAGQRPTTLPADPATTTQAGDQQSVAEGKAQAPDAPPPADYPDWPPDDFDRMAGDQLMTFVGGLTIGLGQTALSEYKLAAEAGDDDGLRKLGRRFQSERARKGAK